MRQRSFLGWPALTLAVGLLACSGEDLSVDGGGAAAGSSGAAGGGGVPGAGGQGPGGAGGPGGHAGSGQSGSSGHAGGGTAGQSGAGSGGASSGTSGAAGDTVSAGGPGVGGGTGTSGTSAGAGAGGVSGGQGGAGTTSTAGGAGVTQSGGQAGSVSGGLGGSAGAGQSGSTGTAGAPPGSCADGAPCNFASGSPCVLKDSNGCSVDCQCSGNNTYVCATDPCCNVQVQQGQPCSSGSPICPDACGQSCACTLGDWSCKADCPTVCPKDEPVNGGLCGVPVDQVCTYYNNKILKTQRRQCRCQGNSWVCDTCPTDEPAAGHGCPSSGVVCAYGETGNQARFNCDGGVWEEEG